MSGSPLGASSARERAVAVLLDPGGRPVGEAMLADMRDGLRLKVSANRLSVGSHGIHIHSVGRCDPPDFQSAGPHWNPEMKKHGRDNPQGAHQGDLPNLSVGKNGRGTLSTTIPHAALSSLLDADGAALVVHASADDNRTDPSGNSGARIACGMIRRR